MYSMLVMLHSIIWEKINDRTPIQSTESSQFIALHTDNIIELCELVTILISWWPMTYRYFILVTVEQPWAHMWVHHHITTLRSSNKLQSEFDVDVLNSYNPIVIRFSNCLTNSSCIIIESSNRHIPFDINQVKHLMDKKPLTFESIESPLTFAFECD